MKEEVLYIIEKSSLDNDFSRIESEYREEIGILKNKIRQIERKMLEEKRRKIEKYEKNLRKILIDLSYKVFNKNMSNSRICLYSGYLHEEYTFVSPSVSKSILPAFSTKLIKLIRELPEHSYAELYLVKGGSKILVDLEYHSIENEKYIKNLGSIEEFAENLLSIKRNDVIDPYEDPLFFGYKHPSLEYFIEELLGYEIE